MSEMLLLGYVTDAWGIRGGLKVRPIDTWEDDLTAVVLQKDKISTPFTLAHVEDTGKLLRVMLKELTDRTTAESWVGASIYVEVDALPALADDEFRIKDLVDRPVLAMASNAPVGKVIGVLFSGDQAFLEVEPTDGEIAVIPFINHFFPKVTPEAVYVAALDGLWE